jgi:hypothetical protein
MSIYIVTGKLGSGKTLACVGRIRDAILAGKRVATNLDLVMDELLWDRRDLGKPSRDETTRSSSCAVQVMRIPDKPTVADLELIGVGNDERDESKNGLIVLDELGAWLNTRSWGDKERQPVIDWLLHSRKKGWDVYFIIQHQNMVDKQVREGLAEFLVSCRRTDRLRIPLLTGLVKHWGINLRPPQIHVATVRYGLDPEALISDRWWYRGRDLYNAYDTRQVFTSERTGLFSMVPPWHLSRNRSPGVSAFDRFVAWLVPRAQRAAPSAPKHPIVARLCRLPPDARVRAWHHLNQRGLLRPVPVRSFVSIVAV